MALFALICIDKPHSLGVRLANREAHLAYAARHPAMIRLAGPFLDEAGDMAGSLFLIEASDIEAARAFNAADPYTQAGLFERVEVRSWRQTLPAPS